jgi:uncharacterized protein YbbC (DUF1343 family)
LPGIAAAAIHYIPADGLYAGELCHGLQFSITDEQIFQPVTTALSLMQKLMQLYPQTCRERLYPTVANPMGTGHLDKLTGVHQSFEKLRNGGLLAMVTVQQQWREIITPYLLY